jgi:hypothetical protein
MTLGVPFRNDGLLLGGFPLAIVLADLADLSDIVRGAAA